MTFRMDEIASLATNNGFSYILMQAARTKERFKQVIVLLYSFIYK